MKNDEASRPQAQFFVEGGPAYRLETRLGLNVPTTSRRVLKVVLLLLLTWVPLVILSWIAGHAFPGSVKVPLLRDPETNGRLLIALPLLELAFVVVHISLAVQARSFEGVRRAHHRRHDTFCRTASHQRIHSVVWRVVDLDTSRKVDQLALRKMRRLLQRDFRRSRLPVPQKVDRHGIPRLERLQRR